MIRKSSCGIGDEKKLQFESKKKKHLETQVMGSAKKQRTEV